MAANRPKGRSLADFSPLSAAETKIRDAAAVGEMAKIGETRPDAASDEHTVRAAFLRFLALGGDDQAPVHEKGLQVRGAWISGMLDLSYAEIAGALVLTECHFKEMPELLDTSIKGLFSLAGSAVPGLLADRLICSSSVFLRQGLTSSGEIRLVGAKIGGNLDCTRGEFENQNGTALNADRITVGGDVFMRHKFRAEGTVRLPDAKIGGNLQCTDGNFAKPDGMALVADRATVAGSVFMDGTFEAKGEVRLLGAKIGGNLGCTSGTFANPNKFALNADRITVGGGVFMSGAFQVKGEVRLLGAKIGGSLACRGGRFGSENSPAINGEGMSVSGAFIFDGVKIVGGAVNVSGAHVAQLVDDLKSWPQNSVLDGFVYGSFAGDAPTAAKDRLAWLTKQSPKHSGAAKNPREFRPQPWIQLRKVLRERGHLEDARRVAIAFEKRRYQCGVVGEIAKPETPAKVILSLRQEVRSRMERAFHWLYGALIGYGYRPTRLLGILVLVWLFCTVLFDIGAHSRVFGPTDLAIAQNPAYDQCNPEKTPRANWTRCKTMPRAYPAFYPPIYALDVLLPIAKLGQQDRWAPLAPSGAHATDIWLLAWATQFAVWLEIAFGWIAGLLLVATISGLAKRNED